MKKILSMIVTLIMIAAMLSGCAGSTPAPTINPEPVAATPAPAAPAAKPAEEQPAQQPQTLSLADVYAKVATEKQVVLPGDITFGKPQKEYTVGLAMLNVSTGFFKALADSVTQELESNGVKALLVDCESDATKQVSQIENFIAQKVNAIIINPADPQAALNIVLNKAFDANIPVVSVDVPPDAGAQYLAAFVTDAYQLGFLVGESAAKQLNEKKGSFEGKLGIIGGTDGNSIAALRNDGMRNGIKSVDTEGKIEEVTFLYAGAYSEESGLKTAENMLVAHPDLDIILGTCDAHVVGAAAAAKRQKLDANIIMGGVDGSRPALEIMKADGPIKALGLNSPVEVGQAAARAIIAYLVDGTIPASKTMVLKPALVTKENMDTYYNPDAAF